MSERIEFRNVEYAREEALRMVELINRPEDQVSREDRERLTHETVENFENHINRGFLEYRKSVTEAGDFASIEWKGQGSLIRDALGVNLSTPWAALESILQVFAIQKSLRPLRRSLTGVRNIHRKCLILCALIWGKSWPI